MTPESHPELKRVYLPDTKSYRAPIPGEFLAYSVGFDEIVPLTAEILERMEEEGHYVAILMSAIQDAVDEGGDDTIPPRLQEAIRRLAERRKARGWPVEHRMWRIGEIQAAA